MDVIRGAFPSLIPVATENRGRHYPFEIVGRKGVHAEINDRERQSNMMVI